MREQLKNFATSALSGAITSGSTSIGLTGGSGSNFPSTGNFVIVIDTELILIASRSSDTLTVASGGRGYDGTTAAAHNNATTVQLPVCAYNINHIWSNLADTFNPQVPPAQYPLSASGVPTGSASAYDNEFEALGAWTLYPSSLPSGGILSVGTDLGSHLVFKRGTGTDNAVYAAYKGFVPGSSAFTVTCKMSDSFNVPANSSQAAEFHFFVSDQSVPTSADPGNAVRMDVIGTCTNSGGAVTGTRIVRASKDVSSSWTPLMQCPVSFGVPLYLRINNDGANRWQMFFGDGLTYMLLVDQTISFTVASLGFTFFSSSGNTNLNHSVVVDFCRVIVGTRLQTFG